MTTSQITTTRISFDTASLTGSIAAFLWTIRCLPTTPGAITYLTLFWLDGDGATPAISDRDETYIIRRVMTGSRRWSYLSAEQERCKASKARNEKF